MKAIITFSILFFFSVIGSSAKGIQHNNKKAKADSIANNPIKIIGKQNNVKIIIDSTVWKGNEPKTKNPNGLNKIEINGEGNSVLINQKKGDQVNVIQNGTRNQINISQSQSSSLK